VSQRLYVQLKRTLFVRELGLDFYYARKLLLFVTRRDFGRATTNAIRELFYRVCPLLLDCVQRFSNKSILPISRNTIKKLSYFVSIFFSRIQESIINIKINPDWF